MSDQEKTNIQSCCSTNGSPQKLIKEKKNDAQNVSKNMKDIETTTNSDVNNKEEIQNSESNSDVPIKIDIKDKEIIDCITKLALPYVKEVNDMINCEEITFDELEKSCSSYIEQLMKTYEKDRESEKNRKSDWDIFKQQEENYRCTYEKICKEKSQLYDVIKRVQDGPMKNVPLVKPLNKSVATQVNGSLEDSSPEDYIIQPSSKSRNSTFTDCEVLAINTVSSSSSCSNTIIISSDDEQ